MDYCSVCDIAHENVWSCPLCDATETIKELEEDVNNLKDKIERMDE